MLILMLASWLENARNLIDSNSILDICRIEPQSFNLMTIWCKQSKLKPIKYLDHRLNKTMTIKIPKMQRTRSHKSKRQYSVKISKRCWALQKQTWKTCNKGTSLSLKPCLHRYRLNIRLLWLYPKTLKTLKIWSYTSQKKSTSTAKTSCLTWTQVSSRIWQQTRSGIPKTWTSICSTSIMPPNYKLTFSRSWNCLSRGGMINSIERYWIRWKSWIRCSKRFRRMEIARKSSWNEENLRMAFRNSVFSKGLRLQKKTLAVPYVELETIKIIIKLYFVRNA